MSWEITISVPDDIKNDLAESFAQAYDYAKNHDDMTKGEFALSKVRQYIRDIYKKHKITAFNRAKTTISIDADIATDPIIVT